MSNTNIGQQSQYNVDDAWPTAKPVNAEDCWERFIKLSHSGHANEYHGAYRVDWKCIRSSFDLLFRDKKTPVSERRTLETRLLESFVKEAYPHLPSEARRFIEVARLKWDTLYNTGTVFIGRHFGLPTRCVDWTTDPLIALFFACRRDFEKHGVVWWMDSDVFSYAIAAQWPLVYGKEKNIQDDFEQDFKEGMNKKVLIRFLYRCLLERPNKQKAHIILSGQYDTHHDEAIYRLGVQKCGRIVIESQMKSDLLSRLGRLGINGAKLGIGDLCVETIATDIVDRFGR